MPFETAAITLARGQNHPYRVHARYTADFAPVITFELNTQAPDVPAALELLSDFADSCRAAGSMGMSNNQQSLDFETEEE